MYRKAFGLLASAIALTAILAGCSAPTGTVEDPAIVGEDDWSIEYVIVNPTDNIAIPCLWKNSGYASGTMSCDWGNPISSIPADMKISKVGEDGWEIEYVRYQEQLVPCLWKNKGYASGVNSCDFDNKKGNLQ